MTAIDKALAALEPLTASVSFTQCLDDPLPDSYIVLVSRLDVPNLCAGDRGELADVRLRAAWYGRGNIPPQQCAKRMRAALRAAGFLIQATDYGFIDDTKHYAAYVDFCTDGACDWNEED